MSNIYTDLTQQLNFATERLERINMDVMDLIITMDKQRGIIEKEQKEEVKRMTDFWFAITGYINNPTEFDQE